MNGWDKIGDLIYLIFQIVVRGALGLGILALLFFIAFLFKAAS